MLQLLLVTALLPLAIGYNGYGYQGGLYGPYQPLPVAYPPVKVTCPPVFTTVETPSKVYCLSTGYGTFERSLNYCRSKRMTLIEILDGNQYFDFIAAMMKNGLLSEDYWLGAYPYQGAFRYISDHNIPIPEAFFAISAQDGKYVKEGQQVVPGMCPILDSTRFYFVSTAACHTKKKAICQVLQNVGGPNPYYPGGHIFYQTREETLAAYRRAPANQSYPNGYFQLNPDGVDGPSNGTEAGDFPNGDPFLSDPIAHAPYGLSCPEGFILHKSQQKCYMVMVSPELSWKNASKKCHKYKGTLAFVNSKETAKFINDLIPDGEHLPSFYSVWVANQHFDKKKAAFSNQQCLSLEMSGELVPQLCSKRAGFVCQVPLVGQSVSPLFGPGLMYF